MKWNYQLEPDSEKLYGNLFTKLLYEQYLTFLCCCPCTVRRLDVFRLREIASIKQNYETWVMLRGRTKDRIKDSRRLFEFLSTVDTYNSPPAADAHGFNLQEWGPQSLGSTNTHRHAHTCTTITTTKHDDWPERWCRWQGLYSACWEQMAGQMHAWIWPWCPQMIEQRSRPHVTLSLPVLLLLCSLAPLFASIAYGVWVFFLFQLSHMELL